MDAPNQDDSWWWHRLSMVSVYVWLHITLTKKLNLLKEKCLSLASLEAEPEMGILFQVFIGGVDQRFIEGSEDREGKKLNKHRVVGWVSTQSNPTGTTGEYITLLSLVYLEASGWAFKYSASHWPWARVNLRHLQARQLVLTKGNPWEKVQMWASVANGCSSQVQTDQAPRGNVGEH